VKCLECDYQSVREETFLDLVMTVKDIFEKFYNSSLEQGIYRYLKPESLQAANQYYCEKCNKKV